MVKAQFQVETLAIATWHIITHAAFGNAAKFEIVLTELSGEKVVGRQQTSAPLETNSVHHQLQHYLQ
jgi:hypothetical protein